MQLRLIALAATISVVCALPIDAQRPSALKGSRTKLMQQNSIANAYDLSRMKDAAMVDRMTANGFLVQVPLQGTGWYLDPDMSSGYPYPDKLRRARPWVLDLINREGRNLSTALPGSRAKISSLVRTEGFQRQLQRRNPNAARGETPLTRSPHLTGSAFDISKLDMTGKEITWWRKRLVALQKCGQIIANEELATNSFHVFVHPEFATKKCK